MYGSEMHVITGNVSDGIFSRMLHCKWPLYLSPELFIESLCHIYNYNVQSTEFLASSNTTA